MTRPGTRIRAIAARVCDARTMERIVDPTVSDLQTEYEDAVAHGRRWERARIWIVGHLALVQVIVLHGGLMGMNTRRDRTSDDRRAVRRTVAASVAITIVGTIFFTVEPFANLVSRSRPHILEFAFYAIPQALPVSIPIGLTFGVPWGLGRMSTSRRTRAAVLALALGASVVSFTMLAWAIPVSNQAFRVAIVGRSLSKGANELTLGELRQQAAHSDSRRLALSYHQRWALASAPLVLALFAVACTSRRRWRRMMQFLAGALAIAVYYAIMLWTLDAGRDELISPFAAAWAPNAALLTLSFVIMRFASPQTNNTAQA
jgi:lipopolysaccharide export LptBFGC system permease protein LptF